MNAHDEASWLMTVTQPVTALQLTKLLAFLLLISVIMISGCAPTALSPTQTLTIEKAAATKYVETTTEPSQKPNISPMPTATYWMRVYPTKKTLLVYSDYDKNDYNSHFLNWGNFFQDPKVILYEDGQLILTGSFFNTFPGDAILEKQLTQKETDAITSKMDSMGFLHLQQEFNKNPDSLYTTPIDEICYSSIWISMDPSGSERILICRDQEKNLVQPMKEILFYLNNIETKGAIPYKPDRLFVSGNGGSMQMPGGKTFPWPKYLPSPLQWPSENVYYLEGKDALKMYEAAGRNPNAFVVFEGEKYQLWLRPIFPHECRNYYFQSSNTPQRVQIPFVCDDEIYAQ